MNFFYILKITFLVAFPCTSVEIQKENFLDMTYELYEGIPIHPQSFFEMNILFNETQPKGFWFQTEEIHSAFHAGTHVDAPCHFSYGKWCIHEIPFERLIVPAVVVDISEKAAKDSDAVLTIEDLEDWEKINGKIPDGSILVVRTGWGKLWPEKKYVGIEVDNHTDLHSPGISAPAAHWLVNHTGIYAVGIDTLSIDVGKSDIYEAHSILFAANIYGVENMANLDKLPITGAIIYAMPCNVQNSSGAFARVFAKLPNLTD